MAPAVTIVKRDGSVVPYERTRIARAIQRALESVGRSVDPTERLTSDVEFEVAVKGAWDILSVDMIHDLVESVLMRTEPDAAKSYILYRAKKQELLPAPSGELSRYIHPAKYGRFREDLGRRETFEETVLRVREMHIEKFPELRKDIVWAFDFVMQKRVLPSMRSMQFAGPAILAHNVRMFNCSFTHANRPDVFGKILYTLLCGCGVGFSVQRHHVAKLPPIGKMGKTVVHHEIEDSIEGWGDALNALFGSAVLGVWVEFSYAKIRPEGSPLKTSGGLAPGHLPLRTMLEQVRSLLLNAQGRHLRPIEVHDLICFAAECVLAGGIRRSSLISLFSYDDEEMLYAKSPSQFEFGGKNNQRQMANNSAVILRSDPNWNEKASRIMSIAAEFYGEPGFLFVDSLEHGTNPCGEIGLEPAPDGFHFCNLCEINCARGLDEEVARAAAIIGTLQASYTNFPYLGASTEFVTREQGLLGVSLTGMADHPRSFDPELQLLCSQEVFRTNQYFASRIGIHPSHRSTCVKPSGTASLVLECASGIHPHHAKRYFRRVTANPQEPVAKFFQRFNPHAVEVKPNGDLSLVFPVQTSGKTLADVTGTELMRLCSSTYSYWITPTHVTGPSHNVSATIHLQPNEKPTPTLDIAAMSFYPVSGDRFPFAPRMAVSTPEDMARWNDLCSKWKPVPYELMKGEDGSEFEDLAGGCEGGSCRV